ncbi:hypothetical protein BJY04DRAFT_186267 [Aspergillus karnatakaensis]|uniref:uncharacterized protein n=1 Tax=Aspergillus karnatakaensis TaxID=1810916 RepID=UPI003CCCB14B
MQVNKRTSIHRSPMGLVLTFCLRHFARSDFAAVLVGDDCRKEDLWNASILFSSDEDTVASGQKQINVECGGWSINL